MGPLANNIAGTKLVDWLVGARSKGRVYTGDARGRSRDDDGNYETNQDGVELLAYRRKVLLHV